MNLVLKFLYDLYAVILLEGFEIICSIAGNDKIVAALTVTRTSLIGDNLGPENVGI